MSLDRRVSRLEQISFLGSEDELDECEFLFMRVPEDYEADPQLEKSQALATKLGKHLICLETPSAHSLPLWSLMLLDRLSDELLDEQINHLEHSIAAMQVSQSQPNETRST